MKGTLKVGIAFLVAVFFTSPLLAEEAAPAAAPARESRAPSAAAAAATKETVWLDDDLPTNAKAEGPWEWESATVKSGTKAHAHAAAKGLASHGFTADPVTLTANQMITQEVWLDPADPPKGIMLKFKLDNGKEVGVYWEGEEEVFTPAEEEEVWYYGLLPAPGTWTTLEVLAEDLGLEQEKVVGVSFVTFDGKAIWDKLSVTQAPATEELEDFPAVTGEEEGTPAANPTLPPQ